MEIEELGLAGLRLITPKTFNDDRGFFMETFRASEYADAGIVGPFVQVNHSRSVRRTLRGLHYQKGRGQAKLVTVVRGRVVDVALDIRPRSPTFGQHAMIELDDVRHQQLFIPAGFAHGFCVTSSNADVVYLVDRYFDPGLEAGIAFDDPDLRIRWPVREPLVSARDRTNPTLEAARLSGALDDDEGSSHAEHLLGT